MLLNKSIYLKLQTNLSDRIYSKSTNWTRALASWRRQPTHSSSTSLHSRGNSPLCRVSHNNAKCRQNLTIRHNHQELQSWSRAWLSYLDHQLYNIPILITLTSFHLVCPIHDSVDLYIYFLYIPFHQFSYFFYLLRPQKLGPG